MSDEHWIKENCRDPEEKQVDEDLGNRYVDEKRGAIFLFCSWLLICRASQIQKEMRNKERKVGKRG